MMNFDLSEEQYRCWRERGVIQTDCLVPTGQKVALKFGEREPIHGVVRGCWPGSASYGASSSHMLLVHAVPSGHADSGALAEPACLLEAFMVAVADGKPQVANALSALPSFMVARLRDLGISIAKAAEAAMARSVGDVGDGHLDSTAKELVQAWRCCVDACAGEGPR